MNSENAPQAMKPETAAKKLGIYLPAAPQEFQDSVISRAEFTDLQSSPPEWLQELRHNGPHPRPEVARKLNVSIAGLARAGMTEPLTTTEIAELLENPPQWLVDERASMAHVRSEEKRVRETRQAKDSH